MSIRSLIVKIGADTQDIDKALAGVGASSKTLADGLKKLGDTPIGKEAQASAEQLKKNLDAVNASIQRTADLGVNAAKGIDAIGGPAKLTTSQLNVMNKAIQDSLEAFRALGQQAPQDLEKVAAAVQAQQKALSTSLVPQTGQGALSGLLNQLPGGTTLLGGTAAIVGGVGAAFALAAKQAVSYADSLEKIKDRTGIGEVALQRLDAIATASGNSLEEVANGVNQFQKRLVSGEASKALDQLGLSVSQLRNLKPDEQFIAIANAIQKIHDPAQETAIAIQLFGRSGAELLPSLKAKVDELADSTFHMSAESVKALDAFGDAVVATSKSLANLVGEFFGKTFTLTIKVARTIDEAAKGALGVGGAGFDFGADTKVALAPLPASPINPNATADATRILNAGLAEETRLMQQLDQAASALGITTKEYEQRLDAVNRKLIQAEVPTVKLSQAQGDLALKYRALGLSNEEIATKILVSAKSVDEFNKSIEQGTGDLADIVKQREIDARIIDLETGSNESLAAALEKVGRRDNETIANLKLEIEFRQKLIDVERGQIANGSLLEGIGTKDVETIGRLKERFADAEKASKDFDNALSAIANDFSLLSQIGQGSLSAITRGIGQTIAGIKTLRDSFKELSAASNLGQTLSGIAGLVGAGISIGTQLVKGIISVFTGGPEWKKFQKDVGRDLGVAISDGLAQQLETDSKKFGRQAAEALHLDQIINEAGGLQNFGFEKAIKGAHDLFSLVEAGKITIDQAGAEFDKVFSELVPNAISKASGLASAAFVELQQTAIRHNVQSPALDQFRSQQIGNVTTGLGTFLQPNDTAQKALIDDQKKLIDLQTQLKNASVSAQADIQKSIAETTADIQKQQNILDATTIKTQGAATGVAGAILASFAELQRQGIPLVQIFKQLGPNIDAFQKQLDRTGFTGGAAFDAVRRLAALASDEIAGPALDGVTGLQQALAGLANTGGLDAETFSGLSEQVGETFKSLVDQGKDGNDVLKLLAPTLQTIFELQERTGFAVDETTQNLIAQAKAQGLVGDQFKSTGAQTVDALNKVADILTAIGKKLGADLPAAADSAANKISNSLDKIKVPDLTIDVGFNVDRSGLPSGTIINDTGIPDNIVIAPAATGGLVTADGIQHFGSGGRVLPFLRRGTDTVPAMLTPGEIVLNAAQQQKLSSALTGSSQPPQHTHIYLGDRKIAEFILDATNDGGTAYAKASGLVTRIVRERRLA